MSAHRLQSAMHRGIDRSLRRLTGGVLLLAALLLLLPSVAFASAFTPQAATDPAQQVAQAGVSVVRLLVSYAAPSNPVGTTPALQCTGLGVLVNSWAATASTEKSSWVLTDGSLVNPAKMTCSATPLVGSAGGVSTSALQLTQIQILASMGNGGYTATSTTPLTLASITLKTGDVKCEEPNACNQGLALIGFSTAQPQPFIDLSSASAGSGQSGIELMNPASTTPVTAAQANQYLTPQTAPANATAVDPGMPVVDAVGNLVGLHLLNDNSTAPLATITTFMKDTIPQTHPANALHDNWDKGIQAYYKQDFATAQTAFKLAASANPQFEAATAFMNRAQTQASNGGGVGKGNQGNSISSTGGTKGLLNFSPWLLSVVALILLLLILALVSFFIARARARRQDMAKYKEDERAAEHRAAVEASQIAEMEARQGQGQPTAWEQGNRNGRPLSPAAGEPVAAPPSPVGNMRNVQGQPYAAQVPAQVSPVLDMRCPQCGKPVASTMRNCPYCHAALSLPEVGAPSPVAHQQPPVSAPPAALPQAAPPVPPAQALPPQAAPPASPPQAAPAPSYAQAAPQYRIADQPTVHFGFSQSGQEDEEKTIPFPYTVRNAGGGGLGLVVGTRTDPGIKRKHKPNEDNLFAAQGAGMFNASHQQFGLFVVADGMGGHANGQDASRLAIQTIIDYILPRLAGGDGLDRDALVQLLTDGVQHANQAVFQRNMEQHADMGTTMTSALVVGTTAYVANVGDSRTYLYREPEGLTKVTNDHSVVASLVEAGLIKPDDIYTHPKRNQIYRSLGEKPAVDVDSFVVDLRPGDKLLLCSDGLWDMVRDPAIQQVMRSATANPEQTGDALIQAALEGGGEDNVSVIVVYVTGSPEQGAKTGFRLLYKPESVQMPPM